MEDRNSCLVCKNLINKSRCKMEKKGWVAWIQVNYLELQHRCEKYEKKYDFSNLKSCVQSIVDMRPSKIDQENMFLVMSKTQNAPSREIVLAKLKATH